MTIKKISLNLTPNQSFGVTIDEVNYNIALKLFDGVTYATISLDNVVVCNSIPCVANSLLIPYEYMTNGGNFYWACQDGAYPFYEKYNDEHLLIYLTDDEIATYGLR